MTANGTRHFRLPWGTAAPPPLFSPQGAGASFKNLVGSLPERHHLKATCRAAIHHNAHRAPHCTLTSRKSMQAPPCCTDSQLGCKKLKQVSVCRCSNRLQPCVRCATPLMRQHTRWRNGTSVQHWHREATVRVCQRRCLERRSRAAAVAGSQQRRRRRRRRAVAAGSRALTSAEPRRLAPQ